MDLVASQPEDIPTVLLDAYAPGALEQAASILRLGRSRPPIWRLWSVKSSRTEVVWFFG